MIIMRCKSAFVLFNLFWMFSTANAQQVGLNFNEQADFVERIEVDETQTTWVRGFVEFFQFYDGERDIQTDPKIVKFLDLKDAGYKTILNIKWRFANKSFPEPGSEEMQDYIVYLGKLLDRVWDKLDIIVVGNEPFIESRASERDDKLVEFYKEITKQVINYRGYNKYIPIYIGSFDNIYIEAKRRPGFVRLMEYAKNNPEVAGVSIHVHHADNDQMDFSLQYTSDHIAENQKILVTEYSLMKHWRNHSGDLISQEFAEKYGYDPAMQVYQYIDHALKNPVERSEWVDFLSLSPWFETRKDYLWQSYSMFKSYPKVHIATYAFRQSYPFNKDFTSTTAPWVLNGIYANRTVVADPETGGNQFNYSFINDFLMIQEDYNANKVTAIGPGLNTDIMIYPLPASNKLKIRSKYPVGIFYVYDQKGRVLISGKGTKEININKLSDGLYFLSIPDDGFNKMFLKVK